MNADDIPTEITKLTYGAPGPALSQKGTAELLAHYWPAIAAHIRAEVLREAAELGRAWSREGYSAQEVATRLDRLADATTPTSVHACGNCAGVDPDTCLMNPQRTTPNSKEQQR